MRIGVHQPNYLPWLGYFRKIAISDCFVFFDDVQIEKGGYTNRVKMRVAGDAKWMTQPLVKQGALETTIANMFFANDINWKKSHLSTIEQSYKKHPFYLDARGILDEIYKNESQLVSGFNIGAIKLIAQSLDLSAKFYTSSELEYARTGCASEKLASICSLLNGTIYCSGSGGKKYNDELIFAKHSVEIQYDDWRPINYPQAMEFIPGLSIIDAIANIGISGVKEMLTVNK